MTTNTIARSNDVLPASYSDLIEEIKERVRTARVKASLCVNRELIRLYWDIGKAIVERQKKEKWGSKVIEKIGSDIQLEFPGIEGFSRPNVFKMRSFHLAYEKVSQAVRQFENLPIFHIPWGHNVILITKFKDVDQQLWYAQKTIENGWSRNVLEMWIESELYERQGKAINNFKTTLPKPQSDLAEHMLKDPFCFDFLTLTQDTQEKDIEKGLVEHIQKFLTELGVGFAFVGQQYPLEVEGEQFYIDLLFYHFKLRRFVIVELKNGPFRPEYAGKMSFYLGAVNALLKHKDDKPSKR